MSLRVFLSKESRICQFSSMLSLSYFELKEFNTPSLNGDGLFLIVEPPLKASGEFSIVY